MAIEPDATPDMDVPRKVGAFLDAAAGEVAYVRPVMMFQAICTCGWKQLHALKSNAEFDALRHYENGRHQ